MNSIYYFTPYSLTGQLGKEYNKYCNIIDNDDDWICLIDADTMFLSPNYGRQINEAIDLYGKEFDLFTCYATRIGNRQQQFNSICDTDGDLRNLYLKVLECEKNNWAKITELKSHISGCFLLFKKSLWNEFKFPELSNEGPILGIDKLWSRTLLINNKRIARIDGLLLVHYYRLLHGRKDKSHLVNFL